MGSQPERSTSERDHALDAARGLLMVLGVFLHAANIYTPGSNWLVVDRGGSPLYGWIADLIHAFRIPAFFWISGYFTAMLFARRHAGPSLAQRLQRIVVPLCATWLLLNGLQELLLPTRHAPGTVWPPLFHLWFLFDLVPYTVLCYALARSSTVMRLVGRLSERSIGVVAFIAASVALTWLALAAARATGIAYKEWYGLTSAYRLLFYLPYMLAGFFVFHQRALGARFIALPWWLFPASAVAIVLAYPYLRTGAAWSREAALLVQLALTMACVGSALGVFRRLFSGPSRLGRLMSDSAYTIYLFHHCIVVAMGTLLLGVALPASIKYAVVVAVALLVPLAIHVWIVGRVPFLSRLFNGRPPRARLPAPARGSQPSR